MRHRGRGEAGVSLLEMMVVVAVMAMFAVILYMTMMGTMKVVADEDRTLTLDQQANVALQEISALMRQAVLPIALNASEKGDKKYFELIDDAANGFGNANCRNWRTALMNGMDSVAFQVPVDAQGDGDCLDDVNHLELGQRTPLRSALSGAYTNSVTDGFRIDANLPLSALSALDPNRLNAVAIESRENVDFATEPTIQATGVAWPNFTAFTVIRYVMELEGGVPIVIRESDLNEDLDGDGLRNGEFHIGRLQLVYSGGRQNVLPDTGGDPVATNGVPQITQDLTGSYILRKTDRSTPIFRLVRYNSSDIQGNGIIDASSNQGVVALQVRVLMFDRNDPSRPLVVKPRWHETVVTLRNMVR